MQGAGNVKYSTRVMLNTHHRHKTLKTQFSQIALPEETPGSYELWCHQHVEPVLKYSTFVFVIWEGWRRRLIKKMTVAVSKFQDVQT